MSNLSDKKLRASKIPTALWTPVQGVVPPPLAVGMGVTTFNGYDYSLSDGAFGLSTAAALTYDASLRGFCTRFSSMPPATVLTESVRWLDPTIPLNNPSNGTLSLSTTITSATTYITTTTSTAAVTVAGAGYKGIYVYLPSLTALGDTVTAGNGKITFSIGETTKIPVDFLFENATGNYVGLEIGGVPQTPSFSIASGNYFIGTKVDTGDTMTVIVAVPDGINNYFVEHVSAVPHVVGQVVKVDLGAVYGGTLSAGVTFSINNAPATTQPGTSILTADRYDSAPPVNLFVANSSDMNTITSALGCVAYVDPVAGLLLSCEIGNMFLGSMTSVTLMEPYTYTDNLFLMVDNTGLVKLYKNTTEIASFASGQPLSSAVSIVVGFPTSGTLAGSVIPEPASLPIGTTLLTTTGGPATNFPTNRAEKAYLVDGVAPEGVMSSIGLLKNGVYVFFDETEALSDQSSIGQHLTQAVADTLYYPFVKDNKTATDLPTSSNDSTEGYTVGSKWYATHLTPIETYVCTSNGIGTATWANSTFDAEDVGTAAFANLGVGPGDIRSNADMEAYVAANTGRPVVRWTTTGTSYVAVKDVFAVFDTNAGTASINLDSAAVANSVVTVYNHGTFNTNVLVDSFGYGLLVNGLPYQSSGYPGPGHVSFSVGPRERVDLAFDSVAGVWYGYKVDTLQQFVNLNSFTTSYQVTVADNNKIIVFTADSSCFATIELANLPMGFSCGFIPYGLGTLNFSATLNGASYPAGLLGGTTSNEQKRLISAVKMPLTNEILLGGAIE